MTTADVAKALGIDPATVRRLRAKAALPPRKRGQGYTEDECAQLRAQLRYQPRARRGDQMRASEAAAHTEVPEEISQLEAQIANLESRVEALEALLSAAFAGPGSGRAVSDSPASVPAISLDSPRRRSMPGRKLTLPSKPSRQ